MEQPIITAAGGLVQNNEGAFLLIYRRGFWDLPKGKLDLGESIPECAVREVQEETGLQTLDLGPFLCSFFLDQLQNHLVFFLCPWTFYKAWVKNLLPSV